MVASRAHGSIVSAANQCGLDREDGLFSRHMLRFFIPPDGLFSSSSSSDPSSSSPIRHMVDRYARG